jgi:transcriptional regulator with XRE-family HTH domain
MSTLPGKILQEKRLELGLSYEKVAEKTLIRVPILKALEDDDYSTLSSETQVHGFIRNYAQFLGVDLSEFLPDVNAQSLDRILPVEQQPEQQPLIKKTNLTPSQPDQVVKTIPKELGSDLDSNSPIPLETLVPRSQKYFEEIGTQLLERRSLLSFHFQMWKTISMLKKNIFLLLKMETCLCSPLLCRQRVSYKSMPDSWIWM